MKRTDSSSNGKLLAKKQKTNLCCEAITSDSRRSRERNGSSLSLKDSHLFRS